MRKVTKCCWIGRSPLAFWRLQGFFRCRKTIVYKSGQLQFNCKSWIYQHLMLTKFCNVFEPFILSSWSYENACFVFLCSLCSCQSYMVVSNLGKITDLLEKLRFGIIWKRGTVVLGLRMTTPKYIWLKAKGLFWGFLSELLHFILILKRLSHKNLLYPPIAETL